MLKLLTARMRRSDVDYRLLVPLLLNSAAVQGVVAVTRVTTSYRLVELDLPVIWFGIISVAYAILPAFVALWLGRFIDRGHDATATWIGGGLTLLGCAGLLVSGSSTGALLAWTALLGLGNLFAIVSQQMLCVRCSGPPSREQVFGNYMVASAVGQGVGPLIVGWAGGSQKVPPTELLFAVGLGLAVLAFGLGLWIRPSRPHGRKDTTAEVIPLTTLMRLPGLWAVMLASVIAVTAADLIIIYLPLLGAERSIDVNAIGGLLTVRATASMAARLIYARLIAGFGRSPLMVASLVGGAAAYGLLAIPMPVGLLYAVTAATGFTIGIATTITITSVVAMTAAGARGTANSLRITGNRIAQVTLPFGASLVASFSGAGGIFIIIAVALAACGAAVHRAGVGREASERKN